MFYRGHSFLCVLTFPRTGNRNQCYPVCAPDPALQPSAAYLYYMQNGPETQLFCGRKLFLPQTAGAERPVCAESGQNLNGVT